MLVWLFIGEFNIVFVVVVGGLFIGVGMLMLFCYCVSLGGFNVLVFFL